MKWITSFVVALVASSAQAKVQHGFSCYGWGYSKILSLVFEGGRYADWISFDDASNQALRPLFHQDEQSLKINSSSLNVALSMGQCKRGSGETLVTCTYDGKGFEMSGYRFQFTRGDRPYPEFWETLDVQRNIELETLDLSVKHETRLDPISKKPTEVAVLYVKLDARTSEGPKHVEFTQRMGEWTSATQRSNSDRCVFDDVN